jgi:hypothetical protein
MHELEFSLRRAQDEDVWVWRTGLPWRLAPRKDDMDFFGSLLMRQDLAEEQLRPF